MKVKLFKDELYDQRLLLIWDCTYEEQHEYVSKRFKMREPLESGTYQGVHYRLIGAGYEISVIWLETFDWSIQDQTTLTHELLHFIFKTLRARGLNLCEATEEAYTYYHDFWLEKLYKHLSKFR